MKNKVIMPVIFSIILAIGVLLGIIIAKSNGIVTTTDKNDNLSCINEVFSLIENEYVDTINIKDLQITAVTNILETMDPHSEYIKPEILNDVNENLYGSFEGIGVSFRIEKDTITIINTIKGGPSEKVGILAGDRIVYVGDTLVAGVKVTNNDAMRLLKGPKKTKVDVKVKRHGISELLDFTITRDVIPTYSIDVSYMIDDNIGFIKLTKFSSTTYDEFITAIKELKKEGMTKLILDLRGNTGGYLGEAVAIADEILPNNNLIVYTEGENRPRSYIFARHRGMLENDEIAVLIDEGSASASEIVAGALQDNDKGIIVGRRSFGKGLVQEQFDLGDNGALRLTVARYYTPTGRCIQKPFSGNKEEYLLEEYGRYESGEMFSIDSIHFADSLKYVTPGGKIVYGGGGIMPDVYVPLKNDSTHYYFNLMVNSSILFQYAFDYSDIHRKEIMEYGDVKNFDKNFHFTDEMFNELVIRAEQKKIKGNKKETEVARELSEALFKAYVARNIFGDEAFYVIYEPMDDILQKAIELLQ
ncbi:MAG: S41 family peptidase [Lentimicrobiaceae bacterium]|nr:S41 family peptidase [Lentimicrobiaceae bacterium]